MVSIPKTPEQFRRMDRASKHEVKSKLLQRNFSAICNSLNPETIPEFSSVLHPGDMERITLMRDRHSKSRVISELLSAISRSMKAWWEVLERVLRQEDCLTICSAMNPWEQRPPEGAAGGRPGEGNGRNGHGGNGGSCSREGPSTSHPVPNRSNSVSFCTPSMGRLPPGPHPPYTKDTPLSVTGGIENVLASRLCGSSERVWRQLAENLGLVMGDQMDIKRRAGDDVYFSVLEKFIEKHQDGATVDLLVNALLKLGAKGQEVVGDLEQKRLIYPVDRVGSGAGGDVADEPCYNEGEGSTSARPFPVPPPEHCAPSEDPNLSNFQTPKTNLYEKSCTMDASGNIVQRSQSGSDMKSATTTQKTSTQGNSTHHARPNDDFDRSVSTESLTENTAQVTTTNDSKPASDLKVINLQPKQKTGHFTDVDEDGNKENDLEGQQNAIVPRNALSHSPQTPIDISSASNEQQVSRSVQSTVSNLIQESQQDKINQLRDMASQGIAGCPSPEIEGALSRGRSTDHQNQVREGNFTVNINVNKVQEIHIAHGKKVKIGEDRSNEGANLQHLVSEPTTRSSVTDAERPESFVQSQEYMWETGSQQFAESNGNTEGAASESICPPPWDTDAHETEVKQRYCDEEEEFRSPIAETSQVPHDEDIIDLQENNKWSKSYTDQMTDEQSIQHAEQPISQALQISSRSPCEEEQMITVRDERREDESGSSVDDPVIHSAQQRDDHNDQQSASSRHQQEQAQPQPRYGWLRNFSFTTLVRDMLEHME